MTARDQWPHLTAVVWQRGSTALGALAVEIREALDALDRAEADADRLAKVLALRGWIDTPLGASPARYRDAQQALDLHDEAVAQR